MKAAKIGRPDERDREKIEGILHGVNFHIGGPEMPEFPISDCFVAEIGGELVGVGGYRIFKNIPEIGKTTLLAVARNWRNSNAAVALQRSRVEFMFDQGVKRIYTNCDNQRVINWYCRKFGYRLTGKVIPKEESFGDDSIPAWTNLVLQKEYYKYR